MHRPDDLQRYRKTVAGQAARNNGGRLLGKVEWVREWRPAEEFLELQFPLPGRLRFESRNRYSGRQQQIVVRGLADRHVARSEARVLYEDRTPPPTAEEVQMRRLERTYRAAMTPLKAPDKRQRRALRKMKGRDD